MIQLSNITSMIQNNAENIADKVETKYKSMIGVVKLQKTKLELKNKMDSAKDYGEWKRYALQYDHLKNIKAWKEKPSNLYDWKYIKYLTDSLRTFRLCGQYKRVTHVIRANCVRNIANIHNPELYYKSYVGTKSVIENYQREVITCLEYIEKLPDTKMSKEQKLEFFAETRHAYGKTALLLSGGGGLGIYHFGFIKALAEKDLFPRVIAGSSAGSMFAAVLGVTKPEDVHKLMERGYINVSAFKKKPEKYSLYRKLIRLIKEGYLMDINIVKQFMRDNLGDLTFQEAYDKTGWILNITVTGYALHDGNHILNYLTAPNVLIWSAVIASCAVPYVFGPVQLYCKNEQNETVPYVDGGRKFVDGSIGADLPMQKLSELFNVNFFIVSQVNPWILPFMNHSENYRHAKRTTFYKVWEYFKGLMLSEFFHRINQFSNLGIIPKSVSRYFNLITQTYTGNITIWPVASLAEFFNFLRNPTEERLLKGLTIGASRTYPKMNRVESNLAIERALEINHHKLKRSILRGAQNGRLNDVMEEYDPNVYIPGVDSRTENKSAGLDRLESLMVPRSASGLFNEQEYLEDSSSESEESQLSSSCVSNKDDD